MANGNGLASGGMQVPPMAPTETAKFKIGNTDIEVPALTLSILLKAREFLLKLAPDLDWILYGEAVLRIVEIALKDSRPDLTFEIMSNSCSVAEIRALPSEMNDLLRISGFDMGQSENPLPETESPGTGMSGQLQGSLPQPESAAETSTG